jgi:hypothetical protein
MAYSSLAEEMNLLIKRSETLLQADRNDDEIEVFATKTDDAINDNETTECAISNENDNKNESNKRASLSKSSDDVSKIAKLKHPTFAKRVIDDDEDESQNRQIFLSDITKSLKSIKKSNNLNGPNTPKKQLQFNFENKFFSRKPSVSRDDRSSSNLHETLNEIKKVELNKQRRKSAHNLENSISNHRKKRRKSRLFDWKKLKDFNNKMQTEVCFQPNI